MRRALEIDEKSFGPDHPNVARDLNNLAMLLQATNRLAEAEPLMRRALTIGEKSFGPDHPDVATALNNLAMLLQATNRLSEAEPLYAPRACHRREKLRPRSSQCGQRLNNLADAARRSGALARSCSSPWEGQADHDRRPWRGELERGGLGKAVLAQNTGDLRAYARALYRAGASDAANRAEGFEAAQWALQNDAADALSAMAARFAKGGRSLASSCASSRIC